MIGAFSFDSTGATAIIAVPAAVEQGVELARLALFLSPGLSSRAAEFLHRGPRFGTLNLPTSVRVVSVQKTRWDHGLCSRP